MDVDDLPNPPPPEKHHRNIQGGTARAAVFGVSDGLVSNVAIVLGFAGASPTPALVRLAGMAGLIGGAVSMAAGEYVSMTAQAELLERELEMERIELRRRPEAERASWPRSTGPAGVDAETAEQLADRCPAIPSSPSRPTPGRSWASIPSELGSPIEAAVSSFLSFSVGAIVPLVPWFFGAGTAAVVASIVLGALAAIAVGAALARFTGRPMLGSAARQLVFSAVPAAITYGWGR